MSNLSLLYGGGGSNSRGERERTEVVVHHAVHETVLPERPMDLVSQGGRSW